ncbi:hypothetical protein K2173_004155 [Erythroxylum novogranatense]|uniref:non-specific serine/threonine protein kinase n=1 Tax=Erythroxylum novogranatense TaxID=1862640 RepID=A0AAV8SXV4_9ROSI|nr:hypothetical protein K2173_004155 [Erythroxylum novogranatense]
MEIQVIASTILSLLFLLGMFQLPVSFPLIAGIVTDRETLLAVKAQITNGAIGKLSSWNESSHFCKWSGVICGVRHQRVVELDLHDGQLVGSLSPHVGNLSFLRIINLSNNSLGHSIPPEIGRLFRLRVLDLSSNMFSGEIPVNISGCINLLKLNVSYNNLDGELPAELGSLSKLQLLIFSRNNLVGQIPSSFGNLSSLERIYGTRNNLVGNIPETVKNLKKLQEFAFGANNLTGTVPPSLYNISSLTLLSLPVNQLHGTLPPDLGLTLPNLEILKFHTNRLSGPVPPSVSNASNLVELSISTNNFTGKVPTLSRLHKLQLVAIEENMLGYGEDNDLNFLYTLANKTNLQYVIISDNNLGGELPELLSNFSTELRKIGFGRNQIRGTIPTEIGNLINLVALGLETNQLTGNIPSSIVKLQSLGSIFLNGNKLSGTIPSSMGNMTSLGRINLRLNHLQGSIPSSLGNCRNLLSLALSQNNLTGPIPKELLSISSLAMYLVLAENELTGSLPYEVGQLVNLGALDVSKNKLSGEIPGTLGNCEVLESLHLEENFFQGTIPSSLSSLRAISDLNLSHNNLSGQIPRFLIDLKLEYLDLSYNDLEGEVPVGGAFKNASATSIMGNKQLCGGIPELNLPRCSATNTAKSKLKLIATISSGILGATLLISALLFCYLQKKTRTSTPISQSTFTVPFLQVTYEDLQKATNGFSSENLIGIGSFGSVYRGVLEPGGVVVAVKVLNLLHVGASRSFMAECEALKNIRHRNLVKLLTVCSSIDFQGRDFKALVYELMVNGSLEMWLHPTDQLRSWNLYQRLSIAIDVANALDYLHNHSQMRIIHCDLKPNNILLDGNMTAHVGDFGLARLLSEDSEQLVSNKSNQSSSIGIKGSIGYVPPEYGMGSEVTTYGDVYSYGIMLLEMFSGKRPTDAMFKDGLNLHSFVQMALSVRVVEVIDPILVQDGDQSESGNSRTLECVTSIFEVGLACSAEFPGERINISSAAAELQRIRVILQNSAIHPSRNRRVFQLLQSDPLHSSWTDSH